MRNRFADVFYRLGQENADLNLVVADISPAGSISKFREEFPNRFINTGVAEQVMIGMTAGMAQRGLRPFAYTIATFALFRPYEFIRNDICYQNLPVTIVGIGGGVTYSTLGSTHHAMEDIPLACGLPNMQVIAPCDAEEVEAATKWCANDSTGPAYLRLGRAGEPDLTSQCPDPWVFGKLRCLRDVDSRIAVIGYGTIMGMAVDVAGRLDAAVFNCHTLKPLDEAGLSGILARFDHVIVIEETTPNGSLGQRIKALASGLRGAARVHTHSLQDEFIHCYGEHADLLAAHGLAADQIVEAFQDHEAAAATKVIGRLGSDRDFHFQMLRIRRVEEAIARHYSEYEMRCPTHLCIGQEAPPVGVMSALREDDLIFSGHRSHGHYLAKGGSLPSMIAELYGRETGCALGRGGSQHIIDLDAGFVASAPILAGTVPIAVGAAWGIKMRGEDRVTAVFFGDGATEEGIFHESMNYAAVHKLPVVFVCENNLYSVHSRMDIRQPPGRPIAGIGDCHGVPAITIDGNDIGAVAMHAREAVSRARTGDGPVLIECLTYRWLEHCGPNGDTDLGYRSEEELSDWQSRCPLARSEAELRINGVLDDGALAAMEADIGSEIDSAFAFAKSSPFPDARGFMDYTYPDRN